MRSRRFAAEAVQAVLDLQGKLAGGGEDQARVWQSGCGAACWAARCCRMGSAKAAVLPVPVCAMPSRSRPVEQLRDGGGLDGGGMDEALPVKRAQQGLGEAEGRKLRG